jgi:ribonuclease I
MAICLFGAQASHAQQKRDVAGQFDYYLLALSWSPTFCAAPGAD